MSHQPAEQPIINVPALRALLTAALRTWDRAYPQTAGLLTTECVADLRSCRLNVEAALKELGEP